MMSCTSILVLLGLCACVMAQEVDTTLGIIRGQTIPVLGTNVDVYYGIPFAEPPIGELRFKHPQPKQQWRPTIKEATQMMDSCQQNPYDSNGMPLRASPTNKSEDCLYLNMWVPSNRSPDTTLTTMIWLYGGSFTSGSINMPLYDGRYLAALQDVIVVGVNYRLGALGFLYFSDDTLPGNMGMVDQVLGIKWVFDNIERFGGNKNLITIFGESAGAASVGHHLLSPMSRDYFTRAIMQSGAPNVEWAYTPADVARDNTRRFATEAGCSRSSDIAMTDCIRQLSIDVILSVQQQLTTTSPFLGPVIDGDIESPSSKHFLPGDPNVLLRRGSVKKTEVLHGFNKDEGTLFMLSSLPSIFPPINRINVSRVQFIAAVDDLSKSLYGSSDLVKPILAQYEKSQVASQRDSYVDLADDIVNDSGFRCPAVALSDQISLWDEVYLYSFEHRLDNVPLPEWMGVMHSLELELVFGQPFGDALSSSQEEKDLSAAMMTYWANFAKTGNPNLPSAVAVTWPGYNTTHEAFLTLDAQNAGGVRDMQGPRKVQCVFWNDIIPLLLDDNSEEQPDTVIVMACAGAFVSKVEVITLCLVSMATMLTSNHMS